MSAIILLVVLLIVVSLVIAAQRDRTSYSYQLDDDSLLINYLGLQAAKYSYLDMSNVSEVQQRVCIQHGPAKAEWHSGGLRIEFFGHFSITIAPPDPENFKQQLETHILEVRERAGLPALAEITLKSRSIWPSDNEHFKS